MVGCNLSSCTVGEVRVYAVVCRRSVGTSRVHDKVNDRFGRSFSALRVQYSTSSNSQPEKPATHRAVLPSQGVTSSAFLMVHALSRYLLGEIRQHDCCTRAAIPPCHGELGVFVPVIAFHLKVPLPPVVTCYIEKRR